MAQADEHGKPGDWDSSRRDIKSPYGNFSKFKSIGIFDRVKGGFLKGFDL
jgi:hypothetical protein